MRLEHLLSGALLKGTSLLTFNDAATRLRRSGAKPQVALRNLKVAQFIDIIEDEIDVMVINRRLLHYEESK